MITRSFRLNCFLVVALGLSGVAFAETPPDYTAADAAKHVGETATVTDKVDDVYQAKGGNIFINMGGTHPNQAFTAFIAAPNAEKFPTFKDYKGATIVVSGKIEERNGKPQIAVTAPGQITTKGASGGDEAKSSPSPSASPKAK